MELLELGLCCKKLLENKWILRSKDQVMQQRRTISELGKPHQNDGARVHLYC